MRDAGNEIDTEREKAKLYFSPAGEYNNAGEKKKKEETERARWEETNESRRYRDCIHDGGKPGGEHKGSRRVTPAEGRRLGQRGH